MSDRLQELLEEARAARPAFDASRSLSGALAKKELRARRERLVRRSAAALSGAALLALLLFRLSVTPASASATTEPPGRGHSAEELAARTLDDAGFAHD